LWILGTGSFISLMNDLHNYFNNRR
jgi:hypothetical protein